MQVKKRVKRICAMLLAVCLTITAGGAGNIKAQAAEKASRYTNMARMAGVTATSDSTENSSLTADKAIDGDTVNRPSRWSSANDEENHAHWLMLAFPQEIKAYSVQIYWEQRNAEIYEVESSLDGESWLLTMDCAGYNGRWYNLTPSSILSNMLGATPYQYGLLPYSAIQRP